MLLLLFSVPLVFIIIFSLTVQKKIYTPPIILSIVFLLSYIMIQIAYGNRENHYWFYSCFAVAAIFFTVGFYIPLHHIRLRRASINTEMFFSSKSYSKIVFFAYAIMIPQIIGMLPFIFKADGSIWRNVRINYTRNDFVTFLNLYTVVFVIISFCIFCVDGSSKNKKRLFISIPTIVPYLLQIHRGEWFLIIISLFSIYLFVKNPEIVKTANIAMSAGSILIVVIVISTLWKFGADYNSNSQLFKSVTVSYFGSQFVAFREQMQPGYELLYGKNTFRFIYAVGHKLGLSPEPINIVQPFVMIYGYYTNVHTCLYYYAKDFGIAWSYLIELVFGIIYGYLYKNAFSLKRIDIRSLVLLSMLMYPLINQFFDDKYLSVFSEWIKYSLFLILLTSPKILNIKSSNSN